MRWVAEAVQGTKWLAKTWRFFKVTDSTQDEARGWVEGGAPDGVLVLADAQTKGRGRWGRSWFSPPGKNLYLTVALKVPPSSPPLSTLSLLVGVAIADALDTTFCIPAKVKWANDIVVDGKKLGGILIETVFHAGSLWALIGIGMNVNMKLEDFPLELRSVATSLQGCLKREVNRGLVLSLLLSSLEGWWEQWAKSELGEFWQRWNELDWLRGKGVRVLSPDGRVLEGVAEGICPDGALKVRTRDGFMRSFSSGEVTLNIKGS